MIADGNWLGREWASEREWEIENERVRELERKGEKNRKKQKIENRPMWKIAQKCVYEIYIFGIAKGIK